MIMLEKLSTEEYSGFIIDFYKKPSPNKYPSDFIHYIPVIIDKATKREVHRSSEFTHTKEDALKRVKSFIDRELSGLDFSQSLVKVGDLFSTSWGYDQTNYDYIIVTAVSPTGKTVKARRTGYSDEGYSGQSYIQKPVAKAFGETFQLKVSIYNGKVNLVGSYPFGHTGEGYKRMGSFHKVKEGETFYETDSQFGH